MFQDAKEKVEIPPTLPYDVGYLYAEKSTPRSFPRSSNQASSVMGGGNHKVISFSCWDQYLCLALFPWAEFRKRKGAVKLHTLLDLHGNILSVVVITTGKVHDVNILDQLIIELGAIYIMDRGYLDFARLYKIHQASAFFVTRTKVNYPAHRAGHLKKLDEGDCLPLPPAPHSSPSTGRGILREGFINFSRIRLYSLPVDKSTGVQCDQIVVLKGHYAKKDYPEKLRRIRYFDSKNNKTLVFLTNNFVLPAITIANLYRCRWQVELFFKWIKQHLRIKAFYGTTENAVKTKIWIAISIYVLVAIVKKTLNLDQSLYTIL